MFRRLRRLGKVLEDSGAAAILREGEQLRLQCCFSYWVSGRESCFGSPQHTQKIGGNRDPPAGTRNCPSPPVPIPRQPLICFLSLQTCGGQTWERRLLDVKTWDIQFPSRPLTFSKPQSRTSSDL